ncbi:MAG: hypothetical protein PHY16_17840 [Methylobacter sp.]|nr:hypothetical protein [Methylobacter sp.]
MTTSNQQFSEKFIGIALLSLAGPFIWVLHFACAVLGNRAGFWVEISVIVITVVGLLALLLPIVKPDTLQRMDRNGTIQKTTKVFFSEIMRLLALLSFFGILWAGIAVFFLPACGSLV